MASYNYEPEDDFNTAQYNSEENAFINANQIYLQDARRELLVSDSSDIQQEQHQEEVAARQEQHPPSENWEVDLIEEVRSYNCLWNTTCRAFKETPKKAEAWRQISAKLNMEG